MKFLITGGAGYIGTNLANYLLSRNHHIIILDNLELGNKNLIPRKTKLYISDMRSKEDLEKIFSENKIDAVFHLAAYSSVQESMLKPPKYFNNNIISSLNLLDAMVKFKVKYIIFSSSAAVYGDLAKSSIRENQPLMPNSVYGQTKKMTEEILNWYDKIYNIKFISLRYFNAAGADYNIGENHKNETHLIPLVIKTALGQNKYLKIFGDNYQTKDGTAIRDYIHITDLSEAHLLSFNYLKNNNESEIFNLGSNSGNSVKEIINLIKQISNKKIKTKIYPKREGDLAILIADCSRATKLLKWKPKKSIKEIIISAYNWHKNQL